MTDIIHEIFTDQINDPENPMRTSLDRDSLFDLAENIKANGLINPITVRPKGDKYEVVAGHRRLTACKIAGLLRVPCVVRELDDDKTFDVMAAENLERADVNPVDEAIFIKRYKEKTQKSDAEIAEKLKRSVGWVQSRLAVGEMPEYMQEYLKENLIKLGVAITLMQIENEQTREMWTHLAVRDGVSIAQAEFWVSDWKRQQLPGGTLSETPPGDYTPGSPSVVKFRCAIDGQEYDARQFRTFLIHESNIDIFNAFVSEMRKPPSETAS